VTHRHKPVRALIGSSTQFEAKTILTGTLRVPTTGTGEFDLITLTK
jgi:hypothetical protein